MISLIKNILCHTCIHASDTLLVLDRVTLSLASYIHNDKEVSKTKKKSLR